MVVFMKVNGKIIIEMDMVVICIMMVIYIMGIMKRGKYIGGVNKYIGKRNGIGKMIWTHGGVYEGEWKNGKRDGYGRIMYNTGDIYYGNFKDSKRNGYGTALYKNGLIHQGYYKDGKMSGYGKYVWS
eukprot:30595_1